RRRGRSASSHSTARARASRGDPRSRGRRAPCAFRRGAGSWASVHLRSRQAYPTTSTARGSKSHRYNPKILLVAVFATVASGFPPGTPAWIQHDVLATAKQLEYPQPDSIEVRLGRFPRVVITGKFRCEFCSR